MNRRLGRVVDVGRTVYREIRREDVKFMAGSIAYHAFVSLLPILLVLSLVVSTVGGRALADRVLSLTGTYLPQSASVFLSNALSERASSGGSLVSAAALLWGTFKIFRALDAAFAELYDTERGRSLLGEVREVAIVGFALALTVVAVGVAGTAFTMPAWVPVSWLVVEAASVVVLVVAFLPVYYVFPNVEVTTGEVLPGVVVAALGWKLLEIAFRGYAALTGTDEAFGVVGSILLVIVWLYFSGLVLLVGAAVNAVLAGRTKSQRGEDNREQVRSAPDLRNALERAVAQARESGVPATEVRSVLDDQRAAVERDERPSAVRDDRRSGR